MPLVQLADHPHLLGLVCNTRGLALTRLDNPIAATTACGPPLRQRYGDPPVIRTIHCDPPPNTAGWLGFRPFIGGLPCSPERAIRDYLRTLDARYADPAFRSALNALHGRLIACVGHPRRCYVTSYHASVCPALAIHRFLTTHLGPATDSATPHVQPPVETSVNDECPGCGLDATHCHCFD